ncbi:hypothetical protein L2E82_35256 [Cichorium intybus]|uniref:Uncharacterized protein n=1 Tax=Cichorium intybus TaxID=13427 RepID=A0ACB9BNL9_CICIN|nr:hypothetical protein L2E82_35256 [Cichorium intybus]
MVFDKQQKESKGRWPGGLVSFVAADGCWWPTTVAGASRIFEEKYPKIGMLQTTQLGSSSKLISIAHQVVGISTIYPSLKGSTTLAAPISQPVVLIGLRLKGYVSVSPFSSILTEADDQRPTGLKTKIDFLQTQSLIWTSVSRDGSSRGGDLADAFYPDLVNLLIHEHAVCIKGAFLAGDALIQLYNNFITTFETKINLLKVAHFAVIVSRQYSRKEDAISYLKGVIEKLRVTKEMRIEEPILYIKMHIATPGIC